MMASHRPFLFSLVSMAALIVGAQQFASAMEMRNNSDEGEIRYGEPRICANLLRADCDDASVEDEQQGGLGLPLVHLPGPAYDDDDYVEDLEDKQERHGSLRAPNIRQRILPIEVGELHVPINRPFSIVNPETGLALGVDSRGCAPYFLVPVEPSCRENGQGFWRTDDDRINSVGCPGLVLEATGNGDIGVFAIQLRPPKTTNKDQRWSFHDDGSIQNMGKKGGRVEFREGWNFAIVGADGTEGSRLRFRLENYAASGRCQRPRI